MPFNAPNNDSLWADFSGLYSKGLLQKNPGVVDPGVASAFVDDINSGINAVNTNTRPATDGVGKPLFENPNIVLGNTTPAGRLNGPQGAFAAQLVGKGSNLYSTFAPPPVGGPEYAVELAELYWASLLRDVPFTEFTDARPPGPISEHRKLIEAACADLTTWAKPNNGLYAGPLDGNGKVTPSLLFRGGVPAGKRRDFRTQGAQTDANTYFAGETVGPYLSQLCLGPTTLGAQPINQRIQVLASGRDFMIDQGSWFAAQNGKAPAAIAELDPTPRHIRASRDLASYTHVDELYQAYFVAFLVMANTWGAAANPGLPYGGYKNQKPFGTMGGPEIAAFLGVVARASIDAVWWQK
jgi:hypothetical protein